MTNQLQLSNGRIFNLNLNTIDAKNAAKNHINNINKQGMGPKAINNRDNYYLKQDAQLVGLVNNLISLEGEINKRKYSLYYLKLQLAKDRAYAKQRDSSKEKLGALQIKLNKMKQNVMMQNLQSKMDNLEARTHFGGQFNHEFHQSNTTSSHRDHRDRRDLSPQRYADDEAQETSDRDLADEIYWADQQNVSEENKIPNWEEAEYVPCSITTEWPTEKELVLSEPVVPKPLEPVKPEPVIAVQPPPLEPQVDNTNLNASNNSDSKGDLTTYSPISRDLSIAMNRMYVTNERKVILDDDECGFCHKAMARHNISLLECGHCFHFMCAIDWSRAEYIVNGRKVRSNKCFSCNMKQNDAPLTPQDSVKIIGKKKMEEVFGRLPSPPPLTLIKN